METELALFLWIFLSRNLLPYLTTNSYGRNSVKKDVTTTTTSTTTESITTPGCVITCESVGTMHTEFECSDIGCENGHYGECESIEGAGPLTCGQIAPSFCAVFGCTLDGTSCTPAAQLLNCDTLITVPVMGFNPCSDSGCCTIEAPGICRKA